MKQIDIHMSFDNYYTLYENNGTYFMKDNYGKRIIINASSKQEAISKFHTIAEGLR